ncbi:HAD-IIB family hydrolase [Mycoplasma sp. ATU-Cv-508]|uniref:HAD family hydrolase n=1 Tax=Mycoplasma sp. ATU-Cv-508 TaxID=2048001 RepID=UPI000FDE7A72
MSSELAERLDAQHEIRLQMIGDLKVSPFDPTRPGLLNLLLISRADKLVKAQEVVSELKLNWILVDDHTVAILPPQISKGFAVKWLAKHLGVSLEKVMTIGDSANDISMLELPVYSYAVANADQKTKKAARFHAAAVDQNGLAAQLTTFLTGKKLIYCRPKVKYDST